ncbi:MAG: radical SAM family heme chaperone HemW [Peptococcaceae bacterium]
MMEALYVHIPFCKAKCFYCDFNSFAGYPAEFQKRYSEALKKEARLRVKSQEINLRTVYLGGGTPTCLVGGLLAELIEFFLRIFPYRLPLELTVESNPGTMNKEKLDLLKTAGVNRISLGVQSFNDELLKRLGRIHTAQEAVRSIQLLRGAGFENINLDLMYGLPGQDLADWEKTLLQTISFAPEHISLYQLKIEEGTPLGREFQQGLLAEFDDELALRMYQLAQKILKAAGYIHYEIANFAKPGYQSIHNQTYWRTKPYLGLGAGAHSFLPPLRIENLGDVQEYVKALLDRNAVVPPQVTEEISCSQARSETIFMGLRLLAGVDIRDFKIRYGKTPRDFFPAAVSKCLERGLIELNSNTLKLTEKGLYLGNLVFEEFL